MSDARVREVNDKEAPLKQKLAELIALEERMIAEIFRLKKMSETKRIPNKDQGSLKQLVDQYNAAYLSLYKDIHKDLTQHETHMPTPQTITFATEQFVISPWNQGRSNIQLTMDGLSKQLEQYRKEEIEAAIDELNPIKTQKQALLARLKAYTDRIESHTNNGLIDFGYGFSPFLFFMNTSRAKNREANYKLAKHLQTNIRPTLDKNYALATMIFSDNLDNVRSWFVKPEDSRGINSDELKGIIEEGKLEPRWR